MGRDSRSNWRVGYDIIRENLQQWTSDPCSAVDDLEALISGLRYFSNALDVAEHISWFSRHGQAVRDRLERGQEAVGSVVGVLDDIEGMCADLRSIAKIREGIRVLNRLGPVQNNPEAAAAAFGNVFSGLGELSAHLPPPASFYSDFLSQSGTFFSDMRGGIGLGPADRQTTREGVHWSQPPMNSTGRRGI